MKMLNVISCFLILLVPFTVARAQELYSDDWVRGCARMDLPITSSDEMSVSCLDLVPNGSTMKISEIFARLNINKEISLMGDKNINIIVFYEWDISKSYKLSVMTAHDGQPSRTDGKIFELDGYGVRFIHK